MDTRSGHEKSATWGDTTVTLSQVRCTRTLSVLSLATRFFATYQETEEGVTIDGNSVPLEYPQLFFSSWWWRTAAIHHPFFGGNIHIELAPFFVLSDL